MLNIRGGSPDKNMPNREQSLSPHRDDYDSYDSEYSSDRSREDKREKKKENHNKRGFKTKNRDRARDNRKFNQDRSRERRTEVPLKDSQICMFYMQGKCNKVRFPLLFF